jgi:hypothetical protein
MATKSTKMGHLIESIKPLGYPSFEVLALPKFQLNAVLDLPWIRDIARRAKS